MVATAARHRKDAFEAAEFLMDYLKSRAPFWKKEISANGAVWVAAKDEDEVALDRW
ncbi:MAG: molybdenum cofactor biosynthesis protein MoaE, partial [Pseudomonadota bacterium]